MALLLFAPSPGLIGPARKAHKEGPARKRRRMDEGVVNVAAASTAGAADTAAGAPPHNRLPRIAAEQRTQGHPSKDQHNGPAPFQRLLLCVMHAQQAYVQAAYAGPFWQATTRPPHLAKVQTCLL